ncbi:MAG: hypothetical protein K5681_10880 [Treponema sp.]|nr:hypothetical protein [Treponema sp.]
MAKDAITLAWNDMRRRHFATAIKRLESKSEVYEDNFEYYLILGIACLYVGDIGAASSYLQMARRIRLTDTRLLLAQAAIFLRRGDSARAIQYYLEIKENDPGNKTADAALAFIRVHGDYDTICRWVDTGRIEQFYPPLGFNPDKVALIVAPLIAAILGVAVVLFAFHRGQKYPAYREDLSQLELSSDERSDAKESDLTNQTYKYILSNKDIVRKYNDALKYFQLHRDNASQIEINRILNSDASLAIKQKARILAGYLEIPDFDTITDVPSYADVTAETPLYIDCWVDWGGKISNAVTYDNGTFTCDLLVGDETLSNYDGSVSVHFDSPRDFDGSSYVQILGQIAYEGGKWYLKGRSVYQKVKK